MTDDDFIRKAETDWPMVGGELDRLQRRRWLCELLPKNGVGVEIGVFRGHFTGLLCEVAQPRKLYLIDPWTSVGETFGWGKEYTHFGALPTALARDEAMARARRARPGLELVVIESTYPKCADQLTDPLDFAYLDASHKYDPTLAELRAMDRQIKPEGWMVGDDWDERPGSQHHGVYQAIQTFVAETDWRIVQAGRGRQWALRRAAYL